MNERTLDLKLLWTDARKLGLASIGMSILGFISIVNSVVHQHTPGSVAGVLVVLTLLSGFCTYIGIKMAKIMKCVERTEGDG